MCPPASSCAAERRAERVATKAASAPERTTEERTRSIELAANELEIVLAQKELTIYFTKTHVAELREVIRVDHEEAYRPTSAIGPGGSVSSMPASR